MADYILYAPQGDLRLIADKIAVLGGTVQGILPVSGIIHFAADPMLVRSIAVLPGVVRVDRDDATRAFAGGGE